MREKVFQRLLVFFPLFLLFCSVVFSGLFYQYDLDELFHAQIVYLMHIGLYPYRDFFLIYTPIFHWVLRPVFAVFGFQFFTLFIIRLIMMCFFIVRVLLLYLIAKKIFTKRIAFVSVALFLMDPFAVFYGMQIRPDAFAVTLLMVGIYILVRDNNNQRIWRYLFPGILFGLATLISIKVIPGLCMILYSIFSFNFKKDKFQKNLLILGGVSLPMILFIVYFLITRDIFLMIQNTVIDSKLMLSAQLFPGQLSFYFKPDNEVLFGFKGKPLTWVSVYVAIGLAILGGIQAVIKKSGFPLILLCSLVIQWIWIFSLHSVFGQYFLTVGWLMSIFGAVGFMFLVDQSNRFLQGKHVDVFITVIFLAFTSTSILANIERARLNIWDTQKILENEWEKVPPNVVAFPNSLFRPLVYPITYGTFIGDVPNEILRRFTPLPILLEEKKVRYLFVSDYILSFYDPEWAKYIRTYYQPRPDGVYERLQ